MSHGIHQHPKSQDGSGLTPPTGPHGHTFMVDGIPVSTLPGGHHIHPENDEGGTDSDTGLHAHDILLPNGEVTRTRMGGKHSHTKLGEESELEGPHPHELEINGVIITSDTPAPMERIVQRGLSPLVKSVPRASDVTPEVLGSLANGTLMVLDDNLHKLADRLP